MMKFIKFLVVTAIVIGGGLFGEVLRREELWRISWCVRSIKSIG